MTRTDQAFIEAFQRANATAKATAMPTPAVTVEQRRHSVHGPHLNTTAARTPLAEAIALRIRQASTPNRTAPQAATMLRSFRWPAVVEQLVEQHRDEYLGLAPGAAPGGLVLGVAGMHAGSGATTTVLALARCLAAEHGPVAIVDGQPAAPTSNDTIATALGVVRTRTLSDAVGSDPRDAIIHAIEDRVSLVSVGALDAAPAVYASAIADLRERHPVVLVDLGSVLENSAVWAEATRRLVSVFAPVGVAIIRCENDLSGGVSAAQRVIESTGAAALGVIENFSPQSVS